ncbi:sensor histidine kinase [Gottfriedia luciferensis]|uniref:sensor histidine kinase n=1 Tax=Gottfriedia luciferensis TaxID=178774 RepID=UPI000B43D1E1|nr:HAMP domain-containing sensor histidine kinase [Gottfriedia luciferensis]
MKTLYLRIVVTIFFVMILSGLLAFLMSNVYYHYYLKPYNDKKLTKMALDIKGFYEGNSEVRINNYLNNISKLGYQILTVDTEGNKTFYGGTFREKKLDPKIVKSVLGGQVYHGIAEFPTTLLVTGFFDNTLNNTIGVPIKTNKDHFALFMRPNVQLQFGELRILFSIILLLAIVLSILFVLISTRYIVRPIIKLTEATKIIAEGKYNVQLQINRQDEIGKLAKHFSYMTRKLEQIDAMRQEFVSNVSHEIQSPLASIQGFSQSLQTKQLTDEQRKNYLSIIEDESRRLSLLSKQLLTLASLDKEESILQKSSFDIADQIKQVVLTTEWGWRNKDLAIDMDLSKTIVNADKNLLHQVWTNLITNSIKFNHQGGSISIQMSNKEEMVLIEIKDTGIGISENDLPKIFNRFFIADKARNRKESSTGLGLAIVKQIIELHHGQIQVYSKEGKGTTFQITIPKM